MSVKQLTEHHLVFLSLNEGCTGLYESIPVKMPHCWKSHVVAQIYKYNFMLTPIQMPSTLITICHPPFMWETRVQYTV